MNRMDRIMLAVLPMLFVLFAGIATLPLGGWGPGG
jgi:hypothetical protein